MAKEKKNEHYVPQLYLEKWAIPNSHQVNVYDKKERKSFVANIENVASERYFYDIDFSDIVSKDMLKELGFDTIDPKKLDDAQYIENFLANQVEGDFKNRLNKIVNRTNEMNLWEKRYCRFINDYDKFGFSFHLAIQYVRVKSVRQDIKNTSVCMYQFLKDNGASKETLDKCLVSDAMLSAIHGNMILDGIHIDELARSFYSLTWILLYNQTRTPFFTSDSPICSIAHCTDPILSMNGLQSKGVEVFFPLSPNSLLIMVDGDYHRHLRHHEQRIIMTDNSEIIKHYNSFLTLYSLRYLFSQKNDFSLIDYIISNKPDAFDEPHTTLRWGNKIYTPEGIIEDEKN